MIRFTAYGTPAPKGSTRAFVVTGRDGKSRATTTGDNPRTKDWQHTIAASAQVERAMTKRVGIVFPAEAVTLDVTFFLPRPKALCTPRKAGQSFHHTKKPDLDKLSRAAKDGMTGVVWTDDSQVVDLIARKRYCAAADSPRAEITVRLAATEGGLL